MTHHPTVEETAKALEYLGSFGGSISTKDDAIAVVQIARRHNMPIAMSAEVLGTMVIRPALLKRIKAFGNHAVCARCWVEEEPGRTPVRLKGATMEYCCLCYEKTEDGIFVRRAYAETVCTDLSCPDLKDDPVYLHEHETES